VGEREGDRKVIEENTRSIMRHGVDPRRAEKMARDAMIKVDRELREKGKR
jgi:hypothetical protein